MKTVNFTNIHIENFGRFTETIQSKLGHRTLISGANGVGKSTIKRAIMYTIGTKDENGKEISGIRPHDENGVDIDGLTTIAELGISVGGAENTLKRTCFQEKNRQGEYTGKDNLQYFVDDVKKGTKKAYDEFVSTIIPATVCISVQELLMKDTVGRRAMLEVFSKHDTNSIIVENPDFEPLRGKLRANTIADLKKACRDKIKQKNKERDAYPARIDEIEKQKVDIDLAELELHRNVLNEQIAENKAKQVNINKQFEEYDRQSKDILDLQFELNGLQQKANEELEKERRKIGSEKFNKDSKLNSIVCENKRLLSVVEEYEEKIEYNESQRKELLKNWELANKREFDENNLICSYCGQEYPKEEKEHLRAKFASDKSEEISKIEEKGKKLKEKIESDKKYVEQLRETISDNKKTAIELETRISELETQYNALPKSIDISNREDVKQLKQQIAEKEAAMKKGNGASKIRKQLQDEREDLQRQLNEVQRQFDKAEENNRIDERVEALRKQQLALSQEIADIERELDLLKSFERKKAELLENDVNENFDLVQFRMFEKMVGSDDLRDVCQILIDGESYDRNLNFSNRLLAEVDICRGFQRKYDVELPILLDNAESIDKDRIPNVSNQLILFQRADCKELTIECLEG